MWRPTKTTLRTLSYTSVGIAHIVWTNYPKRCDGIFVGPPASFASRGLISSAFSITAIPRLGTPDFATVWAMPLVSTFSLDIGRGSNPAHRVLGAWKDDSLIAFFTVVAVDDWAEIGGHSTNAGLQFRPNNGLVHYILSHLLVENTFAAVSYGYSSVQEGSNAQGLHQFKTRVGFEAIPVHRAFVLHPLLQPFANRLSLAMARRVLKLAPANRILRKACGVLARVVGDGH